MKKSKLKSITWASKQMEVKKIKPTPTNYKIKTDLGKERLAKSLEMFGLAGNVVINADGTLIDGNSRVEDAKEKGIRKIWVSYPNRKLSPTEFKEMSAMFDFAKAGEVDIERIKGDLGKTSDFFKKWNMDVPASVLEKLGSRSSLPMEDDEPAAKGKGGKKVQDEIEVKDEMLINLFYTEKQEGLFRKMEEKLMRKFKTEGTSDTVFQAFKILSK